MEKDKIYIVKKAISSFLQEEEIKISVEDDWEQVKLDDLGIDSLGLARLLVMLEEVCGKELSLEDLCFENLKCLSDLLKCVFE